ncbi:MAG: hemerythrin domain-containing protein [Gammaproteobacteria bacterium]
MEKDVVSRMRHKFSRWLGQAGLELIESFTKETVMKLRDLYRARSASIVSVSLSLGALAFGAAGLPGSAFANPAVTSMTVKQMPVKFPIPTSVTEEHAELRAELTQVIQSGGATGQAAQAVAKVLNPHFLQEEEYALPALGLLPELAQGQVTPQMNAVLPVTEQLKRSLPGMLAEHKEIQAALVRLEAAAQAERKPEAERFAQQLMHHALTEEQVTYPAALLVGEYLKLKLQTPATAPGQ